MKKIKEILNEASISRVHSYTQNKNMGIITAHRGGMTDAEKLAANRNLEADLRANKFGFIHVKGRYIENKGHPDQQTVDSEHSYVVVDDPKHEGRLKKFLQDHGKKYNQESVLWKPHDRENATFLYTTKTTEDGKTYHPGDEKDVGTFHPTKIGDYHSKLFRKPGVFTFANEDVDIEYQFKRNVSPLMMGRDLLVDF